MAATKQSGAGKAAKSSRSTRRKPAKKLPDIRSIPRNELPAALLALLDEHRYVVRLLKILEGEARQLTEGGGPQLDTILSVLQYITRQTDNFHHPKEDLIFARVAQDSQTMRDTITELGLQHGQLAESRRAAMRLVRQLDAKATRKGRAQCRDKLLEYSDLLLEHMLLEEREVFAVAYRDLAPADWKKLDRKIAPVNDPVFGPVKSNRYWDLFERYVNHTVKVSSGVVPVGLIETGASRVEKYINKGRDCASRCWPFSRSKKTDAADAWGERTASLDSDEKLRDFEQGEPHYEGSARISWQASATNIVLRGTLKPFLGRLTLEGLQKLVASPAAFAPPASLNTRAIKSKEFTGHWVFAPGCTRAKRTLLYLSGGGFVFPASSFHYRVLNDMAGQLKARGMMVNYRLAPEYPFPAGLEDAVAAYRHLVEKEKVPPEEIIIAGDSAGGGLSLSLLLSIREQGLPMPLCACVFSPFTDVSFSSPSMKYNRWLDPMLPTGERMRSLEVYLGEASADHPLVSPVHADFEGLPPILAQVSSTETLLDDTLRVARKARAQDAKFEVEVWHGMPHVFQIISYLPESRRAIRHAVEFVQKQMESGASRRAA